MRQSKRNQPKNPFSILALDDDPIMTSTLQAYFQRSGYLVDVENDPFQAIERIRTGNYDILLLDFLMTPICGDKVVEQIRQFNQDLFIILLTGHKSLAPPIKTIQELNIQGYYEKSDRFDQLEVLVESCGKSILQMRTIKSYQMGLSSIMEELPNIYSQPALEPLAQSIVDTEVRVLGGTCGFLALELEEQHLLRTAGDRSMNGDTIWDYARREQVNGSTIHKEGTYLITSFYSKEPPCRGAIGIQFAAEPSYEQEQLFEVFVRQTGAVIESALTHTLLSEKNSELKSAYNTLNNDYLEMIGGIRLLVDAKDVFTSGHSDRVSYYSVKIAEHMGKDQNYCEQLIVAGLFHDIGKIGVADSILLKDSRLTDEEYIEIKKHSARGAELLSAISRLRPLAPIVRAHHERFDGKGYPDGIEGYSIPEGARIIGVADAYDAMTSERRYRSGCSMEEAVAELIHGKGSQFDPAIVDVFVKILQEDKYIKTEVESLRNL